MKHRISLFVAVFVVSGWGILRASPEQCNGTENNLPLLRITASTWQKGKCHHGKPRISNRFNAGFNATDGTLKTHLGTDIQCGSNTPITAPFTARITRVENSRSTSGWGSYVMAKAQLPSGAPICYLVGHIAYDTIKVAVGELVPAGTIIGLEGNTGHVSGQNGGYHQHTQIVDCGNGTGNAPFQGYTSKFDTMRHYYNPLQLIDEMKDRTVVRTSLHRARLKKDRSFESHTWITTTPHYSEKDSWPETTTAGWYFEHATVAYAGPITYKKRFLATTKPGYSVEFKPFLTHAGFYNVCFVIPTTGEYKGTARVTMYHTNEMLEQYPWHIKYSNITLPSNGYKKGECVDIGYIHCSRGQKCRVVITTTSVQNKSRFPFYEVKFRHLGDIGDAYVQYRNMGSYHAARPRKTHYVRSEAYYEMGILTLRRPAASRGRTLSLRAWMYRKRGGTMYLPCVNNGQSHCIVPRMAKGDEIHFAVSDTKPCARRCGIVFVYLSGYKKALAAHMIPTKATNSADGILPGHFNLGDTTMSLLLGLRSGVTVSDPHPAIHYSQGERFITKAAFVKMLIMATGPREPQGCPNDPYQDVSRFEWYCPFVRELKKRLPTSYRWYSSAAQGSDLRFFPGSYISRKTAFELAAFAIDESGVAQINANPSNYFCDASRVAMQQRRQLYTLFRRGIFAGFPPKIESNSVCRSIKPDENLTYHQADRIAVRTFKMLIARDQYKDR